MQIFGALASGGSGRCAADLPLRKFPHCIQNRRCEFGAVKLCAQFLGLCPTMWSFGGKRSLSTRSLAVSALPTTSRPHRNSKGRNEPNVLALWAIHDNSKVCGSVRRGEVLSFALLKVAGPNSSRYPSTPS